MSLWRAGTGMKHRSLRVQGLCFFSSIAMSVGVLCGILRECFLHLQMQIANSYKARGTVGSLKKSLTGLSESQRQEQRCTAVHVIMLCINSLFHSASTQQIAFIQ